MSEPTTSPTSAVAPSGAPAAGAPQTGPAGRRHRVVVIGSGFGGLFATQALKDADVDVTVVARTGQHLFQPLLYQVATGILSEGEIAPPTREILRRQQNATVILGVVEEIDVAARTVTSHFHNRDTVTPYDSLIVAAGAGQSYFGNDQFSTFAPGMKTIDDALELRSRIFGAFELAEAEPDPAARERLLTFVVVGAGPTGVEMAGQIRELARTTLRGNFRNFDPADARVILVDGADQVLPPFGKRLGGWTRKSLEDSGVEIVLGSIVTDVDDSGVVLKAKDGSTRRIESVCKVWAAGVQASPLGETLRDQTGVELDKAGRVGVDPRLGLPGHPEVFVVGDMANVKDVPGVAQGAIQEARYAAKLIAARVSGDPEALREAEKPFSYFDKGSMATISKFSAVVKVKKLEVTGFPAWVMWLFLHLLYIAGFKHRVTTLLHWFIAFLGNGRAERVITNQQLIGRLAVQRLGDRPSAFLLRGQAPPEPVPHHVNTGADEQAADPQRTDEAREGD